MDRENLEEVPLNLPENKTNKKPLKSYLSDWPKYLIEMIVIIISISASFWLERMNEARLNKRAQLNLLRNLSTDLASDAKSLENLIRLSEKVVVNSDSVMILSKTANDFTSKKKLLDLFGAILPKPDFVPKNSTFFGAESTLRIEDAELNFQLVDYYRLCDIIKEDQDDESARILNIFQPYLYTTCSADAWLTYDFESFATDGTSFKDYVKRDMFQNIVWQRKLDRQELGAYYRQGLALTKSLRSQLDSKIKDDKK